MICDVFAKFLDYDDAKICFEMIDLVAAVDSVQKSCISAGNMEGEPFLADVLLFAGMACPNSRLPLRAH